MRSWHRRVFQCMLISFPFSPQKGHTESNIPFLVAQSAPSFFSSSLAFLPVPNVCYPLLPSLPSPHAVCRVKMYLSAAPHQIPCAAGTALTQPRHSHSSSSTPVHTNERVEFIISFIFTSFLFVIRKILLCGARKIVRKKNPNPQKQVFLAPSALIYFHLD